MLEVGKTYYVRTLSDHWVGRAQRVLGPFCVQLTGAAWVADSGRLSEFVRTGRADDMEIEPVGTLIVKWEAAIEWPHALFTEAT
jgi:hypothetical protein